MAMLDLIDSKFSSYLISTNYSPLVKTGARGLYMDRKLWEAEAWAEWEQERAEEERRRQAEYFARRTIFS